MSSPLSMLKKTKRLPLQDPLNEQRDSQNVPFRRDLLKEFRAGLTDGTESSDPPLTSHTPGCQASTHSKSKAPLKKGAPPSDFELMSAMMQRVTLLEKTVRSQAQEIEQKDKRIGVLEEKLKLLKESEHTHDLSGREELERRCQQLQSQVYEMENFLNDYGLIWVGDGGGSDSDESEQPHNIERGLCQPGVSKAGGFHMNFDLVLQRIRELNVLAGEGECFVRSTTTGAQFAKKDPVQLSLYRNGIVMFDGPFRSYEEESTQRCMQDLMDGYFPIELQERFPDGVPFEVHDRRDEEFVFGEPWNKFPGEGQAVCGENNESGNKLSVDQFLRSLPKVVVKAGRVIDIRESVRDTLQQGSSDVQSSNLAILIDTPALRAMKDRLQMVGPDRPASARDVITLKMKSEDGNRSFILKMHSTETIGHLRQCLDKHRGAGHSTYDIISAYPQRCYDDDRQTLQSCGLMANATLLLRRKCPQ
uniref:LOW QUALITY PROTEIN: UBX domain-containing protein 11 n=1 Tax=Scatophagus argus TaxID=75038 RepID=UPI001ED7F2D2|nr:LOW QUALITY PROTEIN: UBX domain-containing protein 11 [Scatophagus argus]